MKPYTHDHSSKGVFSRMGDWLGSLLGVDPKPVYNFETAEQEAIALANGYNPTANDAITASMVANHIPQPVEIAATRHFDPRAAEIMDVSRQLAMTPDAEKKLEILSGWREKMEQRAEQKAKRER